MYIQLQDMSPLIRLYPACYNGDIQTLNARFQDVHAHKFTVQKVEGRRENG